MFKFVKQGRKLLYHLSILWLNRNLLLIKRQPSKNNIRIGLNDQILTLDKVGDLQTTAAL